MFFQTNFLSHVGHVEGRDPQTLSFGFGHLHNPLRRHMLTWDKSTIETQTPKLCHRSQGASPFRPGAHSAWGCMASVGLNKCSSVPLNAGNALKVISIEHNFSSLISPCSVSAEHSSQAISVEASCVEPRTIQCEVDAKNSIVRRAVRTRPQ